ncbi:MAG: hypothetical protein ACQES0_05790 [Bacteroidota bacterium]
MVQKVKTLFFAVMLFSIVLPATAQEDEDGFSIGGAVRYNVISTSYESDPTALSTEATWDTWRLNVDGSMSGVDLSFEYRFYPTFATHFIHHGYLGYNLTDDLYMKLGVFQKPFGITSFASHSWWFQGPYYVGLEDDYDIGVGFDYALGDKGEIQLAYFRQAEPQGPASGGVNWAGAGPGRYSYDITSGNNYEAEDGSSYYESIRELNTVNARVAYDVIDGLEIGGSAQVGGIYNDYLMESEIATAFAGHIVGDFAGFNLKAEYIYYDYAAKGVEIADDGTETTYDLETVQMGAYGFNYPVASQASMYVAGLAYSIPVEFGPITNIQPYVDFTMIDKANEDFVDTYHLIPGFLVTAGSIYTYVDFALGKNQPWLTEDFGVGLGQGRTYDDDVSEDLYYYTEDNEKAGEPVELKDMPWNLRFNINIGYYF